MKWHKYILSAVLLCGLVGCAAGSGSDPRPEDIAMGHELRLNARELADQLFTTRSNQDLIGLIALPTSFVNLNDFTETTPFGQYMSEAMFFEFSQRGFPIREYRLSGYTRFDGNTGAIALTRALPPLPNKQKWAAVIVGTYLQDAAGVFVNMRMVRANGDVLRTAQVFLPSNPMIRRLLISPPEAPFLTGSMRIRGETKN